MTFDHDIIMAYVDGELDLVTSRRIERAAEQDEALAAMIAQQRALKTKLKAHFDPALDEPLPERLTRPLEVAAIPASDARRRFGWPTFAAMAASLALGLVIGPRLLAPDTALDAAPGAGPVGVRGEVLVAQGGLADALDRQLASAQPGSADIRIGLTFRDRQGAVCRSFDSAAIAGIACRQDDRWALRQAVAGSAQSTYRQAGASDLLAAIDAMRAGEVADAATERAWQAGGWVAPRPGRPGQRQ